MKCDRISGTTLRSKRFRGAKSEERGLRGFARASGSRPIFSAAQYFARAKTPFFARRKRLLRGL